MSSWLGLETDVNFVEEISISRLKICFSLFEKTDF